MNLSPVFSLFALLDFSTLLSYSSSGSGILAGLIPSPVPLQFHLLLAFEPGWPGVPRTTETPVEQRALARSGSIV